MLFRKKHPKDCAYCKFSTSIPNGQVLCSQKGIRQENTPCRRFCYDPCKRVPPKSAALNPTKFTSEDFSL